MSEDVRTAWTLSVHLDQEHSPLSQFVLYYFHEDVYFCIFVSVTHNIITQKA